ncbi:HlyD family efflux transporter periplasmic adaptor subunit [Salipiger sp. P9]|uniref:HlyD family secretion protein n=1 Tax=Salipiger pentaromativorans TaxID=2943193 RepID=UPI002157C715|nr:HlyD family efflux transporter periplasmic adaptor subunit [Salipiger pentaromativorans]MCR8548681.1 HlyD family efflux transporter periplasmic adaptor subunit [Salipiger pentaromativorans]
MKLQPKWLALAAAIVAVAGWTAFGRLSPNGLPEGIVSANGRLEAVDIDIAAKTGGRLEDVLVSEGDFVTAGDVLAQMDTTELAALRAEAAAQLRRAEISVGTAQSLVAQRQAEFEAAEANVALQQADLDAAATRLERSEQLAQNSTVSQQTLDDDRAAERRAQAALASATASQAAAKVAIGSAEAMIVDAQASVEAARASVTRIEAQIADATLTAPRDGRVQYRLAEPGEVLGSGGRVINMIDVSSVYMSFFLPTEEAGRVGIGTEVRLVMDAAPEIAIPASVSFVSDVAQFTPRTVETEQERLKLTFRVRARIDPELLQRYIKQVKTGLPGMAYVRLDPEAAWPEFLQQTLIE